MKFDTRELNRRLATAIAAIPIGTLPLVVGCTDPTYGSARTTDSGTAGGPDASGQADIGGSDSGVPDVGVDVDPNECTVMNAGRLDVLGHGASCAGPDGTWELRPTEAQALAQEPCGTSAGPEADCPANIEVVYTGDEPLIANTWLVLSLVEYDGELCYYHWIVPGPCEGRALADGEIAVVAGAREASGWSESRNEALRLEDLPLSLRLALANAWLGDALFEHASIASFSRGTLELLHFGAPAALLAAYQQAGLDEVEHAQRCFAIASSYAGRPLAPTPLTSPAPRYGSLADLAVHTFVEAAVGESIAVLAATRQLARCEIGPVQRVLEMIIEDESRHAALAWATVKWAMAVGGDEVRQAVVAAADHARPSSRELPDDSSDPVERALWARHGRLDDRATAEVELDAWDGVIDPTLQSLLG